MVRKNNQDAGYASPNMLLVTDGMGGAAAGDLASAVASTEASRADVRAADAEEMLERIAGVVARANSKLSDLIEDDLELDGMGTTFCGVMFDGTQFALAHIGDSRGYRFRDGELTQITHDHSWVQSLIDEGKITPEQAATHPHRSLILKVLNGQDGFEPDFEILEARLGDRMMFCSDGLSGLLSLEEMGEFLTLPDPEEAVNQLALAANQAGGHDNITIVIGDVVEADETLDQRPGVLVGSATEVSIPRPGARREDKDPPYPVPEQPPTDLNADEVARYAPTEGKRRWPGILAAVLAVALVIGGGAWAVTAFSQNRFFVASEEGYVAIYQGIPGRVLGLGINDLEERTDIAVSNLPSFYQSAVEATISVGSLDGAQETVRALRELAEHCVAVRKQRREEPVLPTATPSASGPGLPSSPPPSSAPARSSASAPASPSTSTSLPIPTGITTLNPNQDPGEC